MYLRTKLTFVLLFIISCQPIEMISPADIDYTGLEKISINAKEKLIEINYNPIFSEQNIEDQITNSPIDTLKTWFDNNINIFGNQNKFVINILDASIIKKEIDNTDATKYEEKTIFIYEIFFLVQYELYDDNDYLIANTSVESFRSTTSQKYISLNETEMIINDLLINTLNDFTKETNNLLKLYMSEYLQ